MSFDARTYVTPFARADVFSVPSRKKAAFTWWANKVSNTGAPAIGKAIQGAKPLIKRLQKTFDKRCRVVLEACQRLLVVRYELAWQPFISERNEVELAAEIKRHRTEKGLSQEELAAKIYVSRQTVSNWETDKTYPDVESLLLLSVLFDVTIDELIKGDVEAMKEAIENDYKTMNALGVGGLLVAIVGVALAIGGISYWGWDIIPSALLGLVVWGIGMAMLVKVERLKKQHDLATYRELLAFSKGEPVDRDNPRSQRARQHRLLKGAVVTAIAAVIGAILGYCSYAFGLIG